jgi:DNA-binding NtrC family response regulator
MSSVLHAKLLRVLETMCFRRLGGTVDIPGIARILAATNKDLKRAAAEGKFREDLFHRLSVIPLPVPPLRDRKEDIPELILHFVGHFNRELGKDVRRASPEAEHLLVNYAWPGNVRELRNVIERTLLLESSDEILPAHLPEEIRRPMAAARETPVESPRGIPEDRLVTIADAERFAIELALKRFGDNKTRAAEALGISRQTLRTKLKDYGMAADDSG